MGDFIRVQIPTSARWNAYIPMRNYRWTTIALAMPQDLCMQMSFLLVESSNANNNEEERNLLVRPALWQCTESWTRIPYILLHFPIYDRVVQFIVRSLTDSLRWVEYVLWPHFHNLFPKRVPNNMRNHWVDFVRWNGILMLDLRLRVCPAVSLRHLLV